MFGLWYSGISLRGGGIGTVARWPDRFRTMLYMVHTPRHAACNLRCSRGEGERVMTRKEEKGLFPPFLALAWNCYCGCGF